MALCECGRSLRDKDLLRLAGTMGKREFQVAGDQLLDVWSLDVFRVGDLDNLENLCRETLASPAFHTHLSTYVNAPKSSAMSSRHILIQRLNCIRPTHLAILLVHVVRTRSRVISDPDAEVLDLERAFLMDDIQGNDFAGRLLQFAEF
jgi:hypothetical protein